MLINNAGIDRFPPPMTEISDEEWNQLCYELNTDLVAPIHLATLFLPHLLKKETSLIANVTAMEAFVPSSREPVYSAAKGEIRFLFYKT